MIPGGGILGRTLTDWTRKRGKKHVSSGHRDITESAAEARKRAAHAAGAGGGGGPGGANGSAQPGGQMPAIQVTAAHPAVIAVANLGDDKWVISFLLFLNYFCGKSQKSPRSGSTSSLEGTGKTEKWLGRY